MTFRDVPIKRKLTAVIMLTSTIVLLLTCAAFATYELITFRKAMKRNLATLAQVIAANSTGAITFDDPKLARETLAALKVEPHIVAAALYRPNGMLFAKFPAGQPDESFPPRPGPDGPRFREGSLIFFEPVLKEGERLGTLYLNSNLEELHGLMRLYGGIVVLVMASSFLIAFALSTALQKGISEPILELASTAKTVSDRKDYSVRAKKYGRDELGQLTDSFNNMLSLIHERDASLREGAERLRLALEAAQTGTWDWNMITKKLSWDEYMYPQFGLRRNEFDGTYEGFLKHVHPDNREQVNRAIALAVDQKREFNLEFRVLWPDATVHDIAARGKAFYDDQGQAVRMAGVSLDVTQRRRAEEEIRRLNAELEQRVQERTAELAATNKELEAFTYSVAHDLRAPLRHVDAYSQVVQDVFAPQLPAEAQKYLGRIRHGVQNMGLLVDDLLNLARVGRQELNRTVTGLNTIVEEVVAELKPETRHRQIEWQIGQLPYVECDPGLIKQVFANLLSNAVKYTRPREKAVIQIGQTTANGQTAIFVRDNGVGFSMKYVDKIFGVFQRLHRPEDFEGTGVGLATVDRIIRKHGGRVWPEAELDKGATFYFTLQAAADEATGNRLPLQVQ
ncbi:MAG: PAS domain-containing protein [Verrucomicrobia bacterium]|nr:PAS domain-containing protein [Verrucomicrobiota bacterium]